MEFSNQADNSAKKPGLSELDTLGGEDLIATVVALTGLPTESMQTELETLIEDAGQDSKNLTIEDLRAAMISYLETLQAELEQSESPTSI